MPFQSEIIDTNRPGSIYEDNSRILDVISNTSGLIVNRPERPRPSQSFEDIVTNIPEIVINRPVNTPNLGMPNCAPTIGSTEQPGWSDCSMGSPNCIKCQPDLNTDCGQMMNAGGFDSAPKACAYKCCGKDDVVPDVVDDDSDSE